MLHYLVVKISLYFFASIYLINLINKNTNLHKHSAINII